MNKLRLVLIAVIGVFVGVGLTAGVFVWYKPLLSEKNITNPPNVEKTNQDNAEQKDPNRLSEFYGKYGDTIKFFYGAQDKSGTVVEGADAKSFYVNSFGGSMYAKDNAHGFYAGKVIPESYGAGFSLIAADTGCSGFATDFQHVFYQGSIIENVDPHSFKELYIRNSPNKCAFFTDNKHVLISLVLRGGGDTNDIFPIENADPETFRLIGTTRFAGKSSPEEGWFGYGTNYITADKNHVFMNNEIIQEADPGSYASLGECYSKDKNHIYYGGNALIPETDPATFEVNTSREYDCRGKDKNYLYASKTAIVPNRDNAEIISSNDAYGKTSKNVYYLGKMLPGADPATFKNLQIESFYTPSTYSIDKQYVYFEDRRMVDADLQTFRLTDGLGTYNAVDKNSKYLNGVKIKDDFKFCSTDASLLPTSEANWGQKLGVDVQNTSTLKFEFCQMPDGGTLVGYKDPEKEGKIIKLFNSTNSKVGEFTLSCGDTVSWGEGYYVPGQSFQALEGNKVILSCLEGEACASYTISEFDLSQLKTTPSGLSAKKVAGPFDCGYRG